MKKKGIRSLLRCLSILGAILSLSHASLSHAKTQRSEEITKGYLAFDAKHELTHFQKISKEVTQKVSESLHVGEASEVNCQLILSESVQRFIGELHAQSERQRFMRPIEQAIAQKGYRISPIEEQKAYYILGLAGAAESKVDKSNCRAGNEYDLVSNKVQIQASIPLALWKNNRLVKDLLLHGRSEMTLACDGSFALSSLSPTQNDAAFQVRSEAILMAIENIPDCLTKK
jgi:hypothetical protein